MLKKLDSARPQYLFVHHFGGLLYEPYASTQDLTLKHIENAHRSNGFLKSQMGFYTGYNAILFKNELVQTRIIGEETAAVRGYNDGNIQLAIAGNYNVLNGNPVDRMTPFQIRMLTEIEEWAHDTFETIHISRYGPHRMVASTQCYGTSLSDGWARNLLFPHIEKKLALYRHYVLVIKILIGLLKDKFRAPRVGGFYEKECQGFINLERSRL